MAIDDVDAHALPTQEAIQSSALHLRELRSSAALAGRAITEAFAKGVVAGKRFDEVLTDMGKRLSGGLLKAALKPLDDALARLLDGGARALAGQFGLSGSGAGAGDLSSLFGGVKPFADGGIVAAPTYFSMGRNLGLMGERGAEAILPLARGPDGRLGVSAGGGGRPVAVTVNISTPDAAGFRQSQGQVEAAIARAVARGRRSL
jgi:phage-related minor tail protein